MVPDDITDLVAELDRINVIPDLTYQPKAKREQPLEMQALCISTLKNIPITFKGTSRDLFSMALNPFNMT